MRLIIIVFLQLPAKEGFLSSGWFVTKVHVSHRSEAQGLLRRITKQSDLSPTMADVILDVELARFVSRMAFGLWLVDWGPSNLTINFKILEFEYHGMEYQLRY